MILTSMVTMTTMIIIMVIIRLPITHPYACPQWKKTTP